MITEASEATGTPELTVLSAMVHGADLYADVVLDVLPVAARHYLEELMSTGTHEYRSDFARRHFGRGRAEGQAEGRAEGEARAVLAVLEARGIDVDATAHARISGCRDLDVLDTWVRRAATAEAVADLFA